ncbi:carboxymuconolactone decarboxylase family protein [Acuticoccus mangrovi]|uniref:Carboxymuconolactone decarboxylase family protein n=1 Tax=Acuticoccus mangrovi TaxID=2796142 RepID=A0A934MG72_9HYPH|nr:carboxymuconolactone decarboxylase family protein [Acuticoccus mangrovi]MBJ3775660.1 carboxymuconolactone decarboxylase family protein [Acuticoccus mangrovi]
MPPSMPSYPPLDDDEWPAAIAELRSGFAGRLNVYRVLAHRPELVRAWSDFRNHVVVETALGRQFSEVVILRTGHAMEAPYEWAHHVVRGRACGLDDARIASLRGPLDAMLPEDAVLAEAVDALLAGGTLSGRQQRDVVELVSTEGLFDLMATVAHYVFLAFIVKSFDVPIDEDIAAELQRNPPPEA